MPFADVTLTVKVVPSSYAGTVTAVVKHGGDTVSTLKAATRNGTARFTLKLRGLGSFPVELSLPASDGIAARTATSTVKVAGSQAVHRVQGPAGPRHARRALAAQVPRARTPAPRFTSQVADAVVAFQKAYGLSRDYVFGASCWKKLETAKVIKAQVLQPVHPPRGGQGPADRHGREERRAVRHHRHLSGATGNTPSGTFHIFIKSLWAPSNYDSLLFRSMGFYKDFAMHGYDPVPPYPASHGCVREPMWVAQWMYDQSWVGETVYLYQ